jgi:N-acetyl-anhydromuramyl-L-alanine amidase AmpD
MSDEGFHTVAFSRDGSAGWSTGADGRIGRWTLDAANSQSGIGVAVDRVGDEIMVCGKMFHTTTPVALWMDKGGYDAYRVEKRFADLAQSSWKASQEKLDTPNRYNIRKDRLTEDQLEQVRGGGWTLDLLQNVVDQFVIHYDVCGTSRQCFKILHDVRGLSIHFMLDIDGTIYQTLDLKERAWHATISNSRSIGIEIANIGAYPPSNMRTLNQWYKPGANGEPRITLPKSMGDGGVLTKGFVGQPIRLAPVTGIVQGEELVQYDLTPQQYRALAKLTATLCRVFPRIECDYPRDDKGELIPRKLDGEKLKKYQGILGHYHVQSNKTDPGPAFQWDKVINESRKLME